MGDRLVWIDCERTGLDLAVDALVEVAALVTDYELNVLGPGVDLVIRPPDEALAQMSDVVRTMHTGSGLLEAMDQGVSLEEAQRQVLEYLQRFVPQADQAPLAGNTIGTDRGFLAKYMPAVDGHLHYRSIDVSSIKELARRWYPRVYYAAPAKHGGHRALADILESVRELDYYRKTLFVALPGPTSEEAQASAAEVTAAFAE